MHEVELKGKIEKFTFSLSVIDKTIGETTSETRVDYQTTWLTLLEQSTQQYHHSELRER